MGLHIADYIVFSVTVAISLAIGIFYSRGQSSGDEYIHGNRNLAVFPMSLSLLLTVVSPILLQGYPTEVYLHGAQYIWANIFLIWTPLLTIFMCVPVIYPLKLTSVAEYYEMRFHSKAMRIIVNLITVFSASVMAGVTIFGPAVGVQGMTGLPAWIGMAVTITVSTIYTSLGGIKAVMWADSFQALLIICGLITIISVGMSYLDGLSHIFLLLEEGKRMNIFDSFDPDPRQRQSFWLLVFPAGFAMLALLQQQQIVQRYISVNRMWKAQLTLVIYSVGFVLAMCLSIFSGVVIYAHYANIGCDPLAGGIIQNANQILPYFVLDVLDFPGIPGIFMASMIASVLSTTSSVQNSIAAVIWIDLLKNRGPFRSMVQSRETTVLRILVVFSAFLIMGIGLFAEMVGGTLFKLILALISPMSVTGGVFFAAILFPWVSAKACFISMGINLTFVLWMCLGSMVNGVSSLGQPLPTITSNCTMQNGTISVLHVITNVTSLDNSGDNWVESFYQISHMMYSMIGLLGTMFVAALLSFIPGLKHTTPVPNKLLCPLVRRKENLYEDKEHDKEEKAYMMS